MSILKPVSDSEREFLALMGETPAQHQAQILAKDTKKLTKGIVTRIRDDLHKVNKETEKALTWSEPTSELVKKLQERGLLSSQIEWVADAYVLFIRQWACVCGASGACMDHSDVFVRHHKSQNDASQPILYLPVKSVDESILSLALPRLEVKKFYSLNCCEACFLDENKKIERPIQLQDI